LDSHAITSASTELGKHPILDGGGLKTAHFGATCTHRWLALLGFGIISTHTSHPEYVPQTDGITERSIFSEKMLVPDTLSATFNPQSAASESIIHEFGRLIPL